MQVEKQLQPEARPTERGETVTHVVAESAAADEEAKPAAPAEQPDAGPKPEASGDDFKEDAASLQRVVWARVKGYPFWPAQIMDEAAAKKWLGGVRPGKHTSLPIMFFGTFEISWLAPSAVVPWTQGLSLGYNKASKRDKRLTPSVEQARSFLAGDIHPQWWTQPEQVVEEVPPSSRKAKSADQRQSKKRRIDAKPSESARAAALLSRMADPAQQAVDTSDESAPEGPKSTVTLTAKRRSSAPAITIPGGQAPVASASNIQPPKYEFTRKNIWPEHLQRPKRLPRDDIPICDCCPAPQADGGVQSMSDTLAAPQVTVCEAPSTSVPERSSRTRAGRTEGPPGKVGCGPDCINRQSFVHCDPKTCPCGKQCTNVPFHLLSLPKVEVFYTGERGWGVRAAGLISRGTFVVEYTGELLDKVEKQRRLEEQAVKGIHDFYMMEHSPGVIIDARRRGNLARLINSSCDPNCETQKWRDAATNEVRIGIFTIRDVLPHEELTYDYQFEHSGLAEQAGAYRCRCGALNCRGTMDTRPDRLRDAFRRIEVFWDGDRRFYRGTVVGFQAARGTHLIRYDDGQRAKENLLTVKHRWLPDDAAISVEGQTEDRPIPMPRARAIPVEIQKEQPADVPMPQGGGEGKKEAVSPELMSEVVEIREAKEKLPGILLTSEDVEKLESEVMDPLPQQSELLSTKMRGNETLTDIACGQSVLMSILCKAVQSKSEHEAAFRPQALPIAPLLETVKQPEPAKALEKPTEAALSHPEPMVLDQPQPASHAELPADTILPRLEATASDDSASLEQPLQPDLHPQPPHAQTALPEAIIRPSESSDLNMEVPAKFARQEAFQLPADPTSKAAGFCEPAMEPVARAIHIETDFLVPELTVDVPAPSTAGSQEPII